MSACVFAALDCQGQQVHHASAHGSYTTDFELCFFLGTEIHSTTQVNRPKVPQFTLYRRHTTLKLLVVH